MREGGEGAQACRVRSGPAASLPSSSPELVSGILVGPGGRERILEGPTADVPRTHSQAGWPVSGPSPLGSPREASPGGNAPPPPPPHLCLLQDLPYLAGSAFLSSSPASRDRAQGIEPRQANAA